MFFFELRKGCKYPYQRDRFFRGTPLIMFIYTTLINYLQNHITKYTDSNRKVIILQQFLCHLLQI